jgi:hypothetical protein
MLFLSDFLTDFQIILKFHESPSGGRLVIPCGKTERRDADATKLIFAFRTSANAIEKLSLKLGVSLCWIHVY